MTTPLTSQHLKSLLIAYIAVAKSELDEQAFDRLQGGQLPKYITLAQEAVPFEMLLDKNLVKHAVHSLASDNSVEETIMFSFMLSIYKLTTGGSGHPLEMGIIRQKITGILPVFEKARDKGLIRKELFSSNATLLLSIAEQSEDMQNALSMLAAGYDKYSDLNNL